ncbi:MAG TPA: alpha/beta hydrolase [Candidatus Dormibacteraeota bacterium]|nr:alpha/beta hydrolase [Candidatus Dormibacteraeota bacterium]
MRHKVADLGGPVHYLDFGGSGPPLLMVHGLGGNALNWMSVGPQLARTHRALALDLAGFGQTPLFGRSATVTANAALVHDFIEKVVGEPVFLIGNSMGGYIAILEAADHPETVASLVLADAAVPGSYIRRTQPTMLGALAALSIPGLGTSLLEYRLRRFDAEALVRSALAMVCADSSRIDPRVVEAHVKLTQERAHLGRQNSRAFVQAFRSIGFRLADPRFWSRIAKVTAPALIVHGALDRVIPVAAARELHRRRPDWKLEIFEGVGHVPMLETPELFMEALTAWRPDRMPVAPAAAS